MVGCSAINCTNRSEQGFIMKVFPRNPERRKEWLIKAKRKNWSPTNHSKLCEVSKLLIKKIFIQLYQIYFSQLKV